MTDILRDTIVTHKLALLGTVLLFPVGGILGMLWALVVIGRGLLHRKTQRILRGGTLLALTTTIANIGVFASWYAESTADAMLIMGGGVLLLAALIGVILRKTGLLTETLRGIFGFGGGYDDEPPEPEEDTSIEAVEEGQCTECGTENVGFASFCRECNGRVR